MRTALLSKWATGDRAVVLPKTCRGAEFWAHSTRAWRRRRERGKAPRSYSEASRNRHCQPDLLPVTVKVSLPSSSCMCLVSLPAPALVAKEGGHAACHTGALHCLRARQTRPEEGRSIRAGWSRSFADVGGHMVFRWVVESVVFKGCVT